MEPCTALAASDCHPQQHLGRASFGSLPDAERLCDSVVLVDGEGVGVEDTTGVPLAVVDTVAVCEGDRVVLTVVVADLLAEGDGTTMAVMDRSNAASPLALLAWCSCHGHTWS
jgi:hypothetical protein